MKKFIFGRPLIQLHVLLVATILCFGVSTASAATPGPAQPQAVDDVSIMSGSWFNPARTYEGFEFQALDNGDFLIIFYTYPGPSDAPGAEQSFILGVGSVEGSTATIKDAYRTFGPVFGPDYDKDVLDIVIWGDFTVEFLDENSARVSYDGADGAGTTDVIRLTNLVDPDQDGTLPSGMSAIWFDPETSGQGWFVEILSATEALVYYFTYDQNGNQAWSIGVGSIVGTTIQLNEMLAGKGSRFGAAFDTNDVTLQPAGVIALEFDNCNAGRVSLLNGDGTVALSYPIVRLTALLGHDCAGFPGFEDGELTVMSNTTDPLLTRYKDAGGTIFDVFGSSDSSGQSVSSDGVLAVTPGDDNVRMSFDEDSGTYEMVNQKNGTRFIYREDADGNRFLTVIDPVTGTSVTVPLDADDDPDTQGDTRSKLAAQVPMRAAADDDAAPQADGDGQLAEVVVQQCGGPTAAAKVDFIAGDRSVPGATPTNSSFQVDQALVVPAQVVGSGSQQRYQARIPVAGPEFSQNALDSRCSQLPDGPRDFCQISQGDDGYCNTLIGGDQGGFASISPEDRLRLFAACQANRAVAQQFCVTHEAKAATQCAGVDYEASYREVPADLWAGASLEGVTPMPQYTAPQTIDPNATGYAFEDIVLPDRATLIDAFTSPATVEAGSGYQAYVYASCLAAGTQLTGTRPSTQEQFTCQVDSSGRCILDVPATASGTSVDAIQVTGPNQFLARLTVPLAPPPDVSNDLTGDWLVTETVTYETCGDGLYTETFPVTLIQEGSTVALCEGGLCVDGVLDGDVVSWSYSYFEDGGMTSIDVVMNVSPDGQSLSGEGAWSWTDGVFSCEGETTLTAERL